MSSANYLRDFFGLLSIFYFLHRIRIRGDGSAVSLKTQELFLIVFATRYVDIFSSYYGIYISFIKASVIVCFIWIVFMLRFPFGNLRYTFIKDEDFFQHWGYCVFPSACIALYYRFQYDSVFF